MSNLELRIDESSDLSFDAVDFVGIPFAPTVEVEDIEGGHRVSITSMGAEGKKTDEFDVMDGADGATWLNGNILIGELAESAVLTADDVYAAPPKVVEVFGKSTQVTTTGKNLVPPTADYYTIRSINGTARRTFAIPVEQGESFCWHRTSNAVDLSGCWCDEVGDEMTTDDVYGAFRGTGYGTLAFTNTDNHAYLVMWCTTTYNMAAIVNAQAQIERGTSFTGYEPYSAGSPSPRPDWPQEIDSVDDLTLHVCGKNLLNVVAVSGVTVDGNTITTTGANRDIFTGTTGNSTKVSDLSVLPFLPAGTFTISCGKTSGAVIGIYNVDEDGTVHGIAASAATSTSWTTTFTLNEPTYITIRATAMTITNLQLEANSTATAYAPYVGQSIPIPLSNHIARSLPDGTRDTLTLSYIGPSTREGWAWYSGEVTRRVTTEVIDGSETDWWKSTLYAGGYYRRAWASNRGISRTTNHLQDRFATVASTSDYAAGTCLIDESLNFRVDNDLYPTLADFKAWLAENPVTIQYLLATPVTHDLGTIELPMLPNPLTAWADGGSAQPTMSMGYEQDINIVIGRLRDAIADMATS